MIGFDWQAFLRALNSTGSSLSGHLVHLSRYWGGSTGLILDHIVMDEPGLESSLLPAVFYTPALAHRGLYILHCREKLKPIMERSSWMWLRACAI